MRTCVCLTDWVNWCSVQHTRTYMKVHTHDIVYRCEHKCVCMHTPIHEQKSVHAHTHKHKYTQMHEHKCTHWARTNSQCMVWLNRDNDVIIKLSMRHICHHKLFFFMTSVCKSYVYLPRLSVQLLQFVKKTDRLYWLSFCRQNLILYNYFLHNMIHCNKHAKQQISLKSILGSPACAEVNSLASQHCGPGLIPSVCDFQERFLQLLWFLPTLKPQKRAICASESSKLL